MSAADVLKMIEEKGVKFVDYRFTDTRGKEQHVTVPASEIDEDVFEIGKMFDGSSIAGWKSPAMSSNPRPWKVTAEIRAP